MDRLAMVVKAFKGLWHQDGPSIEGNYCQYFEDYSNPDTCKRCAFGHLIPVELAFRIERLEGSDASTVLHEVPEIGISMDEKLFINDLQKTLHDHYLDLRATDWQLFLYLSAESLCHKYSLNTDWLSPYLYHLNAR